MVVFFLSLIHFHSLDKKSTVVNLEKLDKLLKE